MTRPPATVAEPPAFHGATDQPDGNVVPENSAPVSGARITSPSLVSAATAPAPDPARKCALVVSTNVLLAITKLKGADAALGCVVRFAAPSAELTR